MSAMGIAAGATNVGSERIADIDPVGCAAEWPGDI